MMRSLIKAVVLVIAVGCVVSFSASGEMKNQVSENRPVVSYEDFGAVGDGKTDDQAAIAKAHAFANERGLAVKADDQSTYFIGGGDEPIVIQTDTDFGEAEFLIDDREVENRRSSIFEVKSRLSSFRPEGVSSLTKGQTILGGDWPQDCLVRVENSNVKHFIRRGANQTEGNSQTDVFLVRKGGHVDESTPIQWDFDEITSMIAFPVDAGTLTLSGGRFTTIANAAESKYNYYARGIFVRRANVVIEGLEHRITGEGEHGAPYRGFIHIVDSFDVTVRDSTLSGHKTYRTIGSAGRPVSMGSYDLSATRSVNVSFVNCRQFNDIHDATYWGIMASNYSRNLLYDGCVLSRFDAHKGVVNATIRNSELGYMGINAIGAGTFIVEDSSISASHFVNFRPDYGSTWQGDFIIRRSRFIPRGRNLSRVVLFGGVNDGQHDFGYVCYLPETILIEDLFVDDSAHSDSYEGPFIFDDINPQYTSAEYEESFPYITPREVVLEDVSTASGEALRISPNPFPFQGLVIEWE